MAHLIDEQMIKNIEAESNICSSASIKEGTKSLNIKSRINDVGLVDSWYIVRRNSEKFETKVLRDAIDKYNSKVYHS